MRRDQDVSRGWVGLAVRIVAGLLRALGATWRIETLGPDPLVPGAGALIGALWHESLFAAAYLYRDRDVVVMISRSRDGDRINAVLRRLGFAAGARGSSSRGGASALRAQIAAVAAGHHGALLIDGPRGPARIAKSGALMLARAAGRPLQPVVFAARPALRFGSWDRTVLPLPFARVVCAYGHPIAVPAGADDATLDATREALERELARIEEAARARLGVRRA